METKYEGSSINKLHNVSFSRFSKCEKSNIYCREFNWEYVLKFLWHWPVIIWTQSVSAGFCPSVSLFLCNSTVSENGLLRSLQWSLKHHCGPIVPYQEHFPANILQRCIAGLVIIYCHVLNASQECMTFVQVLMPTENK